MLDTSINPTTDFNPESSEDIKAEKNAMKGLYKTSHIVNYFVEIKQGSGLKVRRFRSFQHIYEVHVTIRPHSEGI